MEKDKISLLLASSVMMFLGCLRSWYSIVTGYLLPDEGLYYHTTLGNFYIRPLFTFLLTGFKKVFFIRSVFDMLKFGGFVGVICTIGVFYVYYKILKLTCEEEDVRSYSLLTLLFMPMLMLLGVTWLTEAPAFFLSILSILLLVMFFKTHKNKYILSSLFILTPTSMVRESGWIFLVGLTFLLIYLKLRKKENIHWAIIAISITCSIYAMPYMVLEFLGIPKLFSHQFTRLTESKVPIFGIPPERYSPVTRLPTAISNFFVASFVAYGFIPAILVFVGIALGMYEVYKKRSDTASIVLSFSALCGFVGFILFCIRLSTFSLVYMSTIIRFAYVSFPAIVVFPKAYSYLRPLYRKVVFGSIPIFLVFVALVGLPLLQSGISMAPTSVYFKLDYETPYYKAYKYVQQQNSRVCIFAEPFVRISLFLSDNPNVTLYSFYVSQDNDTLFNQIVHYDYWEKILVYGEFYQNYYLSLKRNSPFFLALMQNETSYETKIIWWDSESFLLEVVV